MDVRVFHQVIGISREDPLCQSEAPVPFDVEVRDPFQVYVYAGPLPEKLPVLQENPCRACPNRAEADYPHVYHLLSTLFIPFAACRILCSFSTRANLTKLSPPSPNPMPGETATPASFMRSLQNSRDPIFLKGSGISAHANIVALGGSMFQPACLRPLTRTFLLLSYTFLISS